MDQETSELDQLVRQQLGHVTRRQLVDAGVHRSTVRRRVQAGVLVPVGRRTFRATSTPRTRRGDVIAASLDLDATASHWTAGWLHGLLPHRPLVDVTVRKEASLHLPRHVGPEQPRVRLHATTTLPTDDIVEVYGIPTTSVARTMLGLAALVPAELSQRRLFEIVGSAIDADGPASDMWFWWLLTERRCRGRNGVTALEEALAERARLGPTDSWLERESLRLLEGAELPLPETQRVVHRDGRFAARVDFFYPPTVVIEVMGYAFPRTEAQMAADVARANELQLLGFDVFQFTARQITQSPETFIATVRDALSAGHRSAA